MGIVKEEIKRSVGFRLNEDGTAVLRWLINVAVATK